MKHESANTRPSGKRRTVWPFILLGLLGLTATNVCLALDFGPDFSHDQTGFALDSRHATVRCEGCHVQAIFAGTPRRCDQCHSNTGLIRASAASSQHIRVTGDCEYCHQPNSWLSITRVDHFAVLGSCQSCHNGVTATGKNPTHIESGNVCDDCHRTFTWTGAVFDHANVSANCSSCHNGVVASGKNPTHILSTNNCEYCHNRFNWSPVLRVDHAAVLGSCFSCHNGVTTTGKNPGHIPSSNVCDDCHRTVTWTGAVFNHANVSANCSSCHNGIQAIGKGSQHPASGNDCELCHSTFAWLPAGFEHQSPAFPGEHRRNLDCTDCHVGNTPVVAWSNSAYQPDCAGCHAGDFESGPHKKHENPDVSYSISELRDCSGACHVYTDSSLTTIKEIRNSEHRVSDGDF